MLVSGEAGVGKSSLARLFCEEHAAGTRVLVGACDALQTPRPLGPFLDLAAGGARRVEAALEQAAKPYAIYAALVEELQVTRGRSIVLLEDLHWADDATLDVVRLLARRVRLLPGLVLATFRDDELAATHPVRLLLGELAGTPGVTRVHLDPLSEGAVAELAREHAVDVAALYRRTSGNPFFVSEVLASGGADVPGTVRDAVLARAARLGPGAREVLERVAVVPHRAELWLLDALGGEHMASLDACLDAGMLRSDGDAVAFRHELARRAVEESIGPGRRVLLHREVLQALQRPPAGTPDLARLAHHAEGADDAVQVLRTAPAAAERAEELGAHREAAAQWARALRFAGSLPPDERAALSERHAEACYVIDHGAEALASLEDALAAYRQVGDRRAEGAALCRLSRILWCPGRLAESDAAGLQALEVLEALPEGPELGQAYVNQANLAAFVGDAPRSIVWAERALEVGERLGDVATILAATVDLGGMRAALGDPSGRPTLYECIERGTALGLESEVGRAWLNLAAGDLAGRDYATFDRSFALAAAYCTEHDLDLWLRYMEACAARAALERGRLDEAVDLAAPILFRRGPSVMPRLMSLTVIGLVRARRGDPGAAEAIGEAFAAAEPRRSLDGLAPVAAARAELAWISGRPQDVGAVTEEAFTGAVASGWERNVGELARWRWRAGIEDDVTLSGGPDAATLAGDHEECRSRLGRARLPLRGGAGAGRFRRHRRPAPGPRRAAGPGRPSRGGAPGPAAAGPRRARPAARAQRGRPGQPGRPHPARAGRPRPGRVGAAQRGHRREPGGLPKDGRPPRLGGVAKARCAHPRRGGGHRPAGWAAGLAWRLRNLRREGTRMASTTMPRDVVLGAEELALIDAYWRAANYLSVGQIYLLDNPLLREPLRLEHVKPRLLGHFGTTPGLNLIYAHLNRVIRARDLDTIYICGPGHGGPGMVANTYLEGTYSELYPSIGRDAEGMRKLFRQFSFPGGIPSHAAPETPGSIHEGGELGYALAHAYGAAFDNPGLLVACVVGDGEAETGPLAASWHSNKFLNPVHDGAVLPILHLNGYKIANPTVLARIGERRAAARCSRATGTGRSWCRATIRPTSTSSSRRRWTRRSTRSPRSRPTRASTGSGGGRAGR